MATTPGRSPPGRRGRPLSERKLDMMHLAFFVVHLPVMFVIDLTPLYPAALKPAWISSLVGWYTATYQDQFFMAPPAWFPVYTWLELVYHVPVTLWAIRALVRDDPLIPLNLLVFALETGVTTATCLAEAMSWDDAIQGEKDGKNENGGKILVLAGLYGAYLVVALLMGVDMYARLRRQIMITKDTATTTGKGKGKGKGKMVKAQ